MFPDKRGSAGFALPAAIFLLVVVSMLVLLMGRQALNQTRAGDLALQQARAWQAARSGLDWAVQQVNAGGACVNQSLDFSGSNLAQFTAQIRCTQRNYSDEKGAALQLFELEVTASNGTPDTREDYAWRRIGAVVER